MVDHAPAWQFRQSKNDEAPAVFENVPALQFTQLEELFEDHVPKLHVAQRVAPGVDHVPALQPRHCSEFDALAIVENVPAVQLVQLSELTRDHVPALQCAHWLNPATDQVPAWQTVHCMGLEAPTVVENVPATQLVQPTALTDDDQVPALHCEQRLNPADDHVPAWHDVHCSIDEAPTLLENVPATQFVQLRELFDHDPDGHGVQVLDPPPDHIPA